MNREQAESYLSSSAGTCQRLLNSDNEMFAYSPFDRSFVSYKTNDRFKYLPEDKYRKPTKKIEKIAIGINGYARADKVLKYADFLIKFIKEKKAKKK